MTDSPSTANSNTEVNLIEATPIPKVTTRPNRLTIFATFLLALIAMTTSAIALWQNQQFKQSINALSKHSAQMNILKQALSEQQQTQHQEQQTIEDLRSVLNIQSNQIETLKILISESKPNETPNDNFILQKARFLLELSEMNAHWSNNPQASIALLQEANMLLSQISNPSIASIRQALAIEIGLWQALPTTDTISILNQLNQAISQIDNLSIKQARMPLNQPTKNTQGFPSTWKEGLHESMLLLQKLVIIRHHDTEINPLISPIHEAILRDSLRLQLYQSQWAILIQDNTLYQQALNNAINICKKTFTSDAASTEAFMKNLIALQELSLTKTKPSASTLELVNQLLHQVLDKTMDKPLQNP